MVTRRYILTRGKKKCTSCKNYFKSKIEKTSHKCSYYVEKEPSFTPSIGEDSIGKKQNTSADHFDEDRVASENTAGEEQDIAANHFDDNQVADHEEAKE